MDNNGNNLNNNLNGNNSNDTSVAIASMVLGIIGIITCWVPILGLVLAIIALVLAIKGLNKAKFTNKGKGFAIAGLSCGSVGITLSIIYMFVWIFTFFVLQTTYDTYKDLDKKSRKYENKTYTNRYYNYDNYSKYNTLDDYNINDILR